LKTQILLLTLLISNFFGSAQTNYYPLIDTNKTWHVMESYFPSPTLTFTYKCDGDTSVSDDIYKILYLSGEEFPVNWTKIGYIRETEDHMVYYSVLLENDPDYFEPLLIYDFSVDINDTLTINSFLGFGFTSHEVEIVITEIDSVLIMDEYRNRIRFSCENFEDNFWLEGVGSNNGLLGAGFYCYITCPMMELLCVKEQDELVYQHEYFNECYYVGIEEKNNYRNFEIYPNPADDFVTIVQKSFYNSEHTFTIYNSLGQVISTTELNEVGIDKISTVKLQAGIYFYTIACSDLIEQTGKLIIQ